MLFMVCRWHTATFLVAILSIGLWIASAYLITNYTALDYDWFMVSFPPLVSEIAATPLNMIMVADLVKVID